MAQWPPPDGSSPSTLAPVTKCRERGIMIMTPVTRAICPPSLMLVFRADMNHKYDGIVDLAR